MRKRISFYVVNLLNVLFHFHIHHCLNTKSLKAISKTNLAVSYCFYIRKINSIYKIFLLLCFQRLENLAWATAQVHCYSSSTVDEKTNEASVLKNVVKAAIITADTALNTQQGQGNVVLETKPKILFCDLRLSPGETRSC